MKQLGLLHWRPHMATIHQPINLRRWSQAPPTSLATSPSPNLLARSRSVHSYKPSQSLPGDTSNTRTESMYTELVPNESSLQGSKNEMKPYAAAAYAYTVMKCGCMSVLYTRIDWRIHRMLIQQLQNSRSCLHFASQQSLTHAMSLH